MRHALWRSSRSGGSVMRSWVALLIVLLAAPALGDAQPAESNSAKAVLVTGASTGIGLKITERLAAAGYFVYAGARKEEDLKALGAIKNVQPLRLDVTRDADIAAAVATVSKAGRGLYGLVNNAGIATVGTVADTSPEEFDLVMNVNAYGPVRMVRAFQPLVIAAKGRIVNIGSISGVLARQNLPAYAMSKHAIEALTDSLADHLAPLGAQASVVEPGNHNSSIAQNTPAPLASQPHATNSPA